jgi:arsenate reductase (glutaredoxin)
MIFYESSSLMSLQVYGIPNCGTCKKALTWLVGNRIDHEFVNIRETEISQETIASWVASLGNKPMRNTSGQSYRSLGTEKESWDDAQWTTAFTQDTMLLKRPLFVKEGVAVAVGFRDPDSIRQAILG